MARVLVIADQQEPFSHEDYLLFLKTVQIKYRTCDVVHVGDEIDFHALSDYDHDPDGFSAGHELLEAIKKLKPYYRAFPKMKICNSNHVARLLKRAFKSGIPRVCIREFKQVIGAPKGWEWADEWEIDRVLYRHGIGYSGTQGALNAGKDRFMSCVIGHLHADAGILYFHNGKETIFGMNVGCGMDSDSYAARYGKDHRKKAVTSCGVVLEGRPQLIPMILNHKRRWDGEV